MEKVMLGNSDERMTKTGTYRYKYRLKAAVQSAAFLLLIGGALIWNGLNEWEPTEDLALKERRQRRLEKTCDEIDKIDPKWLIAFYGLGVLYMFLALAIVCDEFFVPALEEMSSKRHMNLSMDVAGATLMAAGGSAPELFSSLFGTFQESEIGFGTIIGSAVFNVLFVIAMCAIFSKEVLSLTWWPLFRDCTFYTCGLVVLTLFVGVISPEEVEVWEAAVLFGMYILYCLIMWQNANIYFSLTGKELVYPEDNDESESGSASFNQDGDVERPVRGKDAAISSIQSAADIGNLTQAVNQATGGFRWQGTFRAGILKLLRDPGTWVETGGVGIVAKIAGDADYVFKQIDANGDGSIDKNELKKLFEMLDARLTDHDLDEVFKQLDTDNDGVIGEHEFNEWYTSSKELIRSQVHIVFAKLDKDHSGTLDKSEIKALLAELDPKVTEEDAENAINAMYKEGSREEITFDEFSEWYEKSIIFERQKKAVEEDMEGVWESLKFPEEGGTLVWVQYILVLPLVLVMACTIPDVRRPGWGKWCYLAFFLSIAWIGGFSYIMVTFAELIGNTLGIPSVIMGVTVLAAGTSVPDLLSSVIVARRGSGDMAVSSSVGSNIFDILVGLPIPWLLYTLYPDTPSRVFIGSDNIWIWICLLIAMLVFVVAVIHCQDWKLTKTLAGLMLLFYVGFLGIAIALEIPFETCIKAA
mmetsp:Transcript_564/g.1065  ORF Transcript_564/g.1065 Transcript_564/m.1065 type:complete len:698 (-) Transcript_564:72-2165(-)